MLEPIAGLAVEVDPRRGDSASWSVLRARMFSRKETSGGPPRSAMLVGIAGPANINGYFCRGVRAKLA